MTCRIGTSDWSIALKSIVISNLNYWRWPELQRIFTSSEKTPFVRDAFPVVLLIFCLQFAEILSECSWRDQNDIGGKFLIHISWRWMGEKEPLLLYVCKTQNLIVRVNCVICMKSSNSSERVSATIKIWRIVLFLFTPRCMFSFFVKSYLPFSILLFFVVAITGHSLQPTDFSWVGSMDSIYKHRVV